MGKGSGRKRVWSGGAGSVSRWRDEMEFERGVLSPGVVGIEDVLLCEAIFWACR